jgi:hypothetical protein
MKYYNIILKVSQNGQIRFLKYRTVNRLEKLFAAVEANGCTIEYVNVYDAKTKERVEGYPYKDRIRGG